VREWKGIAGADEREPDPAISLTAPPLPSLAVDPVRPLPPLPLPPLRPYLFVMLPLPRALSAREGRDAYLAENGFSVAAYDEPWTAASFFAIDFAVPNTRRHRAAIMLHDLHHVATGFGTDLAGEGEVSAWELRGGLAGQGPYVTSLILSGVLAGLLIAPRRTLAAWRAAKGARSLWTQGTAYDALLDKSVGELRQMVGAPLEGIAAERGLHKHAPRHGAHTPQTKAASSEPPAVLPHDVLQAI
jgi:hypothetical protein